MHVVIIGFVWPEPSSSAAGQNMMNLLTALRERNWQVSFLSAAKHSEDEYDLAQLGIDSFDISLNCSSFDALINTLSPDIVIFDRFVIEEQFGWRVSHNCPDALRVLNTEDLHSVREARRKVAIDAPLPQTDLVFREIAAILRCDISLIVSRAEIELLMTQFKIADQQLHYWPLVPFPSMMNIEKTKPFSERDGFVFIGNYRHAPNWDAVLWLRQTLWPLIRNKLPTATLSIYGAYQPPKASQLHSPKDGFLVKGKAKSAFNAIENARVNLAPLRFGSGIKGKVLDAIQTRTPSIVTPIASEGLNHHPWPGIIADTPDLFAKSAVALHECQADWLNASQACEAFANKYKDINLSHHATTDFFESAIVEIAERRQKNFLGAMLRHHSMASTKYMTQWIEAKNK